MTETISKPKFSDKTKEEVKLHDSIWTAEVIWNKYKDIIYSNGSFYAWEGQVYKKIEDLDWMIMMTKRFPAFNEKPPNKQKEIMEVYKRFAKIDKEKFNQEDGLCFLNKYLDLSTITIHDHDKSRINTILIPYDYDNFAQCPLWLATIEDIFEKDNNKIRVLQEFFGYCLTRKTNYEKAMFLVGEGGSGKSVIMDCLQYIIDPKNISFISLRHFVDSVRLCSIENKLVNVCTEVPKRAEDYEETFKKIVTGEYIQVSPKYIPQYDIKPFAKLIFAINQWPHIDDQSTAFFRRMLILSLNKVYPEEQYDRDLKEKLKSETAGILNWAIEGLRRLKAQKGFWLTEEMKETISEVKNLNNPIGEWAKDHVMVEKGSELIKSDVYAKYRVWCIANGYKPVGHGKFSIEFYRIFSTFTKKNFRHASGNRERTWPNLAWLSESSKAIEPIPEQQVEWDD